MIVSLLTTSTGISLIFLFTGIILIASTIVNHIAWMQRGKLIKLIRFGDLRWPDKIEALERISHSKHVKTLIKFGDWKELYRPAFFQNEDGTKRNEP